MAKLVVENLTKRFGKLTAVDRLSFVAEDREFLVLIGPSGCGKSTTLSLIAGLDEVNAGRIYIGERPVNHLHPKDRDIAMVFQNYALYPHMNVYANMAFGLSMRGYSKAEIDGRIHEAAEILGIGDLLLRKPKALSGGQRQRVAVGRAIVRKPAVFLFDEPLSNLDAKLRVQMRAELSKLHQRLNYHHRLRDPRPGRGHDHGDPHRAAQGRGVPADRPAARALQPAGQHLHGRFHRHPAHEPSAGADRRAGWAPDGGRRVLPPAHTPSPATGL